MSGRLPCPECGTPLRIRDRSLVGRRVNCPECMAVLRVDNSQQNDGSLVIRGLTKAEKVAIQRPNEATPPKPLNTPSITFKERISGAANSPLIVIWLVVLAVTILFTVIAFNHRSKLSPLRSPSLPIERRRNVETTETAADVFTQDPVEQTKSVDPIDPSETQAEPSVSVEPECPVTALAPLNLDEPLPWPPVDVVEVTTDPDVVSAAEPVVRVDVGSKMAQKVVLYRQPPVSRRLLIDALQEQLGVPIRYDAGELGVSSLEEKVAFELKNTTLGDVVRTVSDSANWRMEVEDTGLRLTKKDVNQNE